MVRVDDSTSHHPRICVNTGKNETDLKAQRGVDLAANEVKLRFRKEKI
jgi:hypothetical protein